MPDTDVLIVGAGPTGLVLAIFLSKLGVRVRIIDKTEGPGTTSRALVVHARTLEFYRQIGISERVIDAGVKFAAVNLWANGDHVGRVPFGDIGIGLSRYPFMLIFPQDEHEQLLIEVLGQLGTKVDRCSELVTFEEVDGFINAQIKTADGTIEKCDAYYIAGCDGARSIVRERLELGFPGGTYSEVFYVADIAGGGPPLNGEINVALDDADLLAIFPMKGEGRVRLVGNVSGNGESGENLQWNDVTKRVIEHLNLKVDEVKWFSTYHVHHRVASAFRRGAAFLLGDAAHIHSPVGGQGMNTGIGDAVNLAWKIAGALNKQISPSALDTFETERIAFAHQLVNSTDRVFQFASAQGPVAQGLRTHVVPTLLSELFKMRSIRRGAFKLVSQIAIKYPDSALSSGSAGRVKGGDRLPWVELKEGVDGQHDNYQPLLSLDWQVHCYGEASSDLEKVCKARKLALHTFAWIPVMKRAGLTQDTAYLIRPDGYIGLVESNQDSTAIGQYLEQHCIQPGNRSERSSAQRAFR